MAENVVNRWCFRRAKGMVLQGNVPGGKTVTVGIDSPLDRLFSRSMGQKYVGETGMDEKSEGAKSEGAKSVVEKSVGEKSMDEKKIWVKSFWAKSV